MAITQKQFYARTFAFLAAALLLLLAIVGGSLYLTRLTQQNFDKVVMTRAVRSAAADLCPASSMPKPASVAIS